MDCEPERSVERRRLTMLLCAVVGCVLGGASAAAQTAPVVSVAKPVAKQVTERDDFIGRFAAVDSVDIRARVTGYLDKIHFTDGDLVKAGDLLFTIDQRPYIDARDQAVADLAAAKASLDFTSGDVERADSLLKSGNITGQIADQRRQAMLSARASVNRAQAALARAELDMEFTEIRAPISGRISRHFVSTGNLVGANDTVLTTIVTVDPIDFYFDVDERAFLDYLRNLAPGPIPGVAGKRDISVTLTGEEKASHFGTIDFVDVALDQASGTMRARAVLPNTDGSLTPGLFGRIAVAGSQAHEAILIPDEAIASDQDRKIVFVLDKNNTVSARVIRPGPGIDGYRVVREGLGRDDVIVVNGLARVRPGATVSPKSMDLPRSRLAAD